MTLDEAWQLENVLTGTYVDSTRIDHPGIEETDDYRYQITDIDVSASGYPLSRAALHFDTEQRFTVETTIRFNDGMARERATGSGDSATDASSAPAPDAVRDHPYMRGVGGKIRREGDALTVAWTVPDRHRYDQRLTYFKETVEDLLG